MYEIYAYGNNDSLYGIFNAIAAIMGANSYIQSLAIVAFCGFAAASLAYAFAPHKLIGWQWLASVLLVYSILLVPKVTVGIVDKLGTQPVQVVSNVPFGLAFFGNLTSAIGNTLTEVFETAFQTLPGPAQQSADLAYQRHGVMFGNTLIKRTRQIVFDDPNFRTDVINFVHNCTMYDLADGTIDPATFGKAPAGSGDLWSLMATPNPARFSTVTTGGTSDSRPCPDVYQNLDARMPAVTNITLEKLAALLNPNLPISQAVTEVSNQAVQAYLRTGLGASGITAAGIVRQNGLINAINDTSDIIGQKINDPGSLILGVGRAQATAQTNAAWINFGKMAEDALPLIRNVIEAIIYALFPFVLLLLFFTYGTNTMKAIQSYVVTLVWIQLWPPIYAILNYMASIASAKHIAAAAQLGGSTQGLAMVSASPIYANTISDQAVVGYLVLAIPSIAWAAIRGMQTVAQAALLGTGSIQGNVSSAMAAAGSGNMSMGNVGMDKVDLAPHFTSASATAFTDAWGTSRSVINADGARSLVTYDQNLSRLATTFDLSEREATQIRDSAQRSEALGQTQREQASRSEAAALASLLSVQQEYSHSSMRTGGSSHAQIGRDSTQVNKLLEISEAVNNRLGLARDAQAGKEIAANVAAGIRATAGAQTTIGTPGQGLLGSGVKASAGVEAEASAGVRFTGRVGEKEAVSDAYDFARGELEKAGITSGKEIAQSFQQTDAYEWGHRSASSGTERFEGHVRDTDEYSRAADKSYRRAQEEKQILQFMREVSMGIKGDATNYLARALHKSGRLGEYVRADPLQQKQMAYDVARDYVNGAFGSNNAYLPYEGAGAPNQTPGSVLGFHGNLADAYKRIELEGGSPTELEAKRAAALAIARVQQRERGVQPSNAVSDDVGRRVSGGLSKMKSSQARDSTPVIEQAAGTVSEYNKRSEEIGERYWVKGASALSKDAAATLEKATGEGANRPGQPTSPSRSVSP